MPTPKTWTPTAETTISNNLFGALQWTEAWVRDTLTFSFGKSFSSYSTDVDTGYGPTSDPDNPAEPFVSGYKPLNSAQQESVRLALKEWAQVGNLKFAEVADNHDTVGDLRFAFTSGSQVDKEDAQAWAYLPAETATGGDVWFNKESTQINANWAKGGYEYMTALHEIGHAIGLKHPFESVDGNEQTLPSGLDSRSFTVMSYSADPGRSGSYFSFEPTTPMVLDILAMQQMYGKNMSYHATDTVYTFLGTGTYHKTIWDAGGTDTFVYDSAGNTGTMTIDLRVGYQYGSKIGQTIKVYNADQVQIDTLDHNVYVAVGAIIERATGGESSSDSIFGNGVSNILSGRGANDKLFGGAGNDTLIGGTGLDRLVGGDGADRFKLTNGADTIVNFTRSDVIQLENAVFTHLTATGTLNSANFRANATGTAVDSNDFILYETDTGGVYYDSNGSGAGGRVLIAIIGEDKHLSLTAGDFAVV